YRFGKWMPHITYSRFYTDSDNDKQVQDYIDGALALGQRIPISTGGAIAGGVDPAIAAATAATTATTLAGLANGLSPLIQEQASITLGVVYDINSRVKAKFDVTKYDSFGEYKSYTIDPVSGAVSSTDLNGYGRFGLTDDGKANTANLDSSTTIYTFAIDAVF
ncbi:MAG: hypothetical protein KUG73_06700, partial [Pseudomonadales bacterium]|nr:hypothetical protein [Pseudomonadales bacterium]